MKTFIPLLITLVCTCGIKAQNSEIDSLKKAIPNIKNLDTLALTIYRIGAKTMIYDADKAYDFSDRLDSLYRKTKHNKSNLLSLQLKAKIQRWEDKPHEAIRSYLQLLKLSKDSSIVANVEFNLGIIYTNLRLNEEALQAFQKALNIYKLQKKAHSLPDIYNCMADVYNYNLFDYSKAEELYQKAVSSYLFLTEEQQNRTEAIQSLSVIHNNLGRLYIYLEKFKQSEEHLKQSAELAQSMNDQIGVLHANITLAELYRKQELYRKVLQVLAAFEDTYSSFALYLQSEYLREWSNALAGVGQFEKAFYANKAYTGAQDSLYNASLSSNLARLKKKHENEQAQNSNKAGIRLKELKYQYFSLLSVLLLIALLVFILYRKRNKLQLKKLNAELEQKQIELKNNELKISNVHESINTNILDGIYDKLNAILESDREDVKNELRNIISSIKTNVRTNEMDSIFKRLHSEFFTELIKKHPKLSENDRKISALIRLQFSNADIAKLLKIETNSVVVAKSRLRKKLNLDAELDLFAYLSKF